MPVRSSNPSKGALRNRRYRRREREELTLAQSEVPRWVVVKLIDAGWIDENEAEDPHRLGEAVLEAAKAHLMSAVS